MFDRLIRLVRLALLTTAFGTGCVPLAAAQFAGPRPVSLASLVRAVAPVVLGIAVSPSGAAPATSAAAESGFIVTPDGMIVTNNHVIAGSSRILVTLNDGRQYRAALVGTDDLTDIAIEKIAAPGKLPSARWGDSAKMQVGDWILAAGNPFALGNSLTAGFVSALGRDIGDGPFDHFLQLDAPINPGNSGGPAFDMRGEVIGINTAIVSPSGGSVGVGFAIPRDNARKIVDGLIAHGAIERGWLGVVVADAPFGAEVTSVEADGPAGRAGIAPKDVVLAVDGAAVSDSVVLIRAISSEIPGAKVVLTVRRNSHIMRIPVVVDRRPGQLGG